MWAAKHKKDAIVAAILKIHHIRCGSQYEADREKLVLLKQGLDRVIDEYVNNRDRVSCRSFFNINFSHSQQSVRDLTFFKRQTQHCFLLKQFSQLLHSFLVTYNGGCNNHSVKVLMAKQFASHLYQQMQVEGLNSFNRKQLVNYLERRAYEVSC